MLIMNDIPHICRHCALPIMEGQPRWTAREPKEFWHYHCAEEAGLRRQPAFKIPKAPRQFGSN